MKKDFKKGDVLEAKDLQDMANSIEELEASVGKVVAGGRGEHGSRPPLAYYNVTEAEVLKTAADETAAADDSMAVDGLVRSVEYEAFLDGGKINAGDVLIPAPRVWDYEGDYVAGKDGLIPIPVYAKAVRDVSGKKWLLSELTTGAGLAATVASCTLPDGTTLALQVYTEGLGNVLCFSLVCGENYYY